jgi:hypothetical protein
MEMEMTRVSGLAGLSSCRERRISANVHSVLQMSAPSSSSHDLCRRHGFRALECRGVWRLDSEAGLRGGASGEGGFGAGDREVAVQRVCEAAEEGTAERYPAQPGESGGASCGVGGFEVGRGCDASGERHGVACRC